MILRDARYKLMQKDQWKSLPPKVVDDLINEACEILITETKPKDNLMRIGVTAYSPATGKSASLTLPRPFLMAEAIMRCKWPVPIRDGWFEFSVAGEGSRLSSDDSALAGEVVSMGDGYCCFREPGDVHEDGCRLKVYTDGSATTEVYESIIEFFGLDADGNEIRTTAGANIRTGEPVNLLASAGNVTTTNAFASLSRVVKPSTSGIISVFAINPDDSSENLIARYQPGEQYPNYRRYLVPTSPDSTTSYVLTVLARRRFVAATQDNDDLCIDNFAALKEAMLYVNYIDASRDDVAQARLAMALDLLSKQAVRARPASQTSARIVNLDELTDPTTGGY